jgi:hypothetical protein
LPYCPLACFLAGTNENRGGERGAVPLRKSGQL